MRGRGSARVVVLLFGRLAVFTPREDSLSEALHDWKYARKCVLGTAVVFGGRERLKLGVWTLVTFPNYNAV